MHLDSRTPRTSIWAVLFLGVALGGCASREWRPIRLEPRAAVETEPERVRVTHVDGSQVVMRRPSVRNDSIVQSTPAACRLVGYERAECDTEMPAVALSDVAGLEVEEFDSGAVGVVVLGVVVGGVIYLLSQVDLCLSPNCG